MLHANMFSIHSLKFFKRLSYHRCLYSTLVNKKDSPEKVHHPGVENTFAYNVLKSYAKFNVKPAYDCVVLKTLDEQVDLDSVKWKYLNGDELCRSFNRISLMAKEDGSLISDSKYTEMCSSIAAKCPELSDNQLKQILAALTLWNPTKSARAPNLSALWKAIDFALLARYKVWKPGRVFEFVELWYQLNLLRMSDFVFHAIVKMSRRTKQLKAEELVLLLFYLNILRTLSKKISMFSIEEKLQEIVDDLTIEEIGIVCMGFFKTQHTLHVPGLIDTIITKLLENASTVHEITLASIVKALRYRLPISLWHRLPELMNTLQPQVERFRIQTSVHIPLMLTTSQTLHEDILTTVSEKLIQQIEAARLKDMEKVMYVLTLLNFQPKTSCDVFEMVVNELGRPVRETEFNDYPVCLVAVLHYLVQRSIFVDHLIDRVLDMSFIRATFGRTNYNVRREILFIDSTVELEHPSYRGNRLPIELRDYLSKRYSQFLPEADKKMSMHQKFEFDVMRTVEQLTDKRCAQKYVLPNHPRADIVVRFDENGGIVPLPEDILAAQPFKGPLYAPGPHFMAIVPLSRNMFIRNLDGAVTGETLVKLRQLKILGYTPLKVCDKHWPVGGSDDQKLEYLKNLIKNTKFTP